MQLVRSVGAGHGDAVNPIGSERVKHHELFGLEIVVRRTALMSARMERPIFQRLRCRPPM